MFDFSFLIIIVLGAPLQNILRVRGFRLLAFTCFFRLAFCCS